MAEAFLKLLGGHLFSAESAGLEPQPLDPLVVEVMKEDGLDISKNQSKSVFDFSKQGKLFDYVITVYDQSVEEKFPVFPGIIKSFAWNVPDPESSSGSEKERLSKARELREAIKDRVIDFVHDMRTSHTTCVN
jgi:arsenate reductase